MRNPLNRYACWLFSKVYARWLWEENVKVLKVYGWRTALIGYGYKGGMRKCITPCFWIFK